ncbi:Tetratricopeptide repeat protein [uncultured archaeon]|nr:Tetratricopeptide repeat protein [uncultured archaeon]
MMILIFLGFLLYGVQDSLKSEQARDDEDFTNADIAGSMGRWDKAVDSYDHILSRNQSNSRAWRERGYALQRLGRYNEANESYQKAT